MDLSALVGDILHTETNLRHSELETIVRHRIGRKDECLEIQLLVAKDLPQRLPVVLLFLLAVVGDL